MSNSASNQIEELRPWLQWIRERMEAKLGGPIQLILYGSCVRGEATPESDVDLVIIVPELSKPTLDVVLETTWQASLEAGKVFSPIPVAIQEIPLLAESLWFQTVQREGIAI